MAHWKPYAQIMAHRTLVLPLQTAALNGVSPVKPSLHTTPQSNGFTESCVKIVKHTLQHAKYSGTNPRIAIKHLKEAPVDAKLPSPSQMLYNHKICTTIPSRIFNTDLAALRFKNTLRIKPSMPSPMLISASSNLHHSMLVSPLPHLTP